MERKTDFLVIAKRIVNGVEQFKRIVVQACTKYHAVELAMAREPNYQTYRHNKFVRTKVN
jgi:hypothetical protein